MNIKKFPYYKQADVKDCGPTCIKIIAKHYGKIISIQSLRKLSETTRTGSSLLGLSDAAEKVHFRTLGVKVNYEKLLQAPLPCIVHWNRNHFVVLFKTKGKFMYVSDPAIGILKYSKQEFLNAWIGNNSNGLLDEGWLLLMEPSPEFYNEKFEENQEKYSSKFIFRYLLKYKKMLSQLLIGLLAGSLLQLAVPFLTQSIVDVGIKNQDIHFVYLILFAQLFLFLGRIGIDILRGWILLHVSTRINISLVSDFFIKLMNLPISFFDVRMTGDIFQRISDHRRIEQLLTNSSLNTLFSLINIVIFGFVLAWYDIKIFFIFFIGSAAYLIWIMFFLKKRRELDYKKFSVVSQEQSKVVELINGMQEIKLHNAEKQKRWGWEYIQANLFRVSIKNLALEQYQSVGSGFINELKNIIITAYSALLVIEGDITLGMMLAIAYIVGQLNSPITQLINFIRQAQDAKISVERLSEIHNKEDERQTEKEKINQISLDSDIIANSIFFKYTGTSNYVIKDISFKIPSNKITAIVGVSGSGKTTLMKLILKFYEIEKGNINVGNIDLANISQRYWRELCGVVMQESYIFNDTIANNIAIGEDQIDKEKLLQAAKMANIREFIDSLPLSFNTVIGSEGLGMSTGQKQRLFIARAIYKNPSFLFFDEATSALDANNERIIMENLNLFFQNKTVFIIAHRLSTVKNADQILVLDKGKIIESGNHRGLVEQEGAYYNLVKNQLELGN